jgi:hypothetical protein
MPPISGAPDGEITIDTTLTHEWAEITIAVPMAARGRSASLGDQGRCL